MTTAFLVRCVLAAFATFRLSRMFTWEDGPFGIFLRFRGFLGRHVGETKYGIIWTLAELFNCPYCLGVWLVFFMFFFIWRPSTVGDIFLAVFAIAGMQSMLLDRGAE